MSNRVYWSNLPTIKTRVLVEDMPTIKTAITLDSMPVAKTTVDLPEAQTVKTDIAEVKGEYATVKMSINDFSSGPILPPDAKTCFYCAGLLGAGVQYCGNCGVVLETNLLL